MKMYAVRDKAVDAFMRPFFCQATGEAIRTFADAVNDSQSPFFRHPGDFELYSIGEFSVVNGEFKSEGVSKLVSALDVTQKVA